MPEFSGRDRRRHPRARIDLEVSIDAGGMPELPVRALNVSASGIYCVSDKSLGELKRVDLVLRIEDLAEDIRARAVIIREEKLPDGTYGIGMFFTRIADEDRATISEIVARQSGKG